jgi:uncharacterized protein YdaU (DUF1376 family)
MAMWMNKGSLPNKEVILARAAGLTLDKWRRVNYEIMQKLTVVDDMVTHDRLLQEWKISLCKTEKRRAAGYSGFVAKSLKKLESGQANAGAMLEQCSQQNTDFAPEIKIKNKIKIEESKKERLFRTIEDDGTRAADAEPEGFVEFWRNYPKRLGQNPRAPALTRYKEAFNNGATAMQILRAVKAFAAEMKKEKKIGTPYVPMAKAWLHQQMWAEYGLHKINPEAPLPPAPKHGEVITTVHSPDKAERVGKIFLKFDSDEWSAWASYLYKQNKPEPQHWWHNGWFFGARWPPGDHHLQPAESSPTSKGQR